jgi:hypothetical protein
VGETTVEQIPLLGIGLDYPEAQLDSVGEGGDVASPLGQEQGAPTLSGRPCRNAAS